MYYLISEAKDGHRHRHRLSKGRTSIGRDRENTIPLVDGTVSRLHAEIVVDDDGKVRLRDLQSTNGTQVDGRPVSETEVSFPCTISFGEVVCRLDPAPPAPRPQRRFYAFAVAALLLVVTIALSRRAPTPPAPALARTNPTPAPAIARAISAAEDGYFDTEPEYIPPTAEESAALELAFAAIAATGDLVTDTDDLDPTLPTTPPIVENFTDFADDDARSELAAATPSPSADFVDLGDTLLDEEVPAPAPLPESIVADPEVTGAIAVIEAESDSESALFSEMPSLGPPMAWGTTASLLETPLETFVAITEQPATDPNPVLLALYDAKPFAPSLASPFAPSSSFPPPAEPAPPAPAAKTERFKVLILGDSLSLCGFGARLDQRFRQNAASEATYTYMACGTVPNCWLKIRGFAQAKTACGYETIESMPHAAKPRVYEDIYGMTKGHKPQTHPVPKLEDLLEKERPDVLVMQSGSNLFNLFQGPANPERHASEVRAHLRPFFNVALGPNSSVKKIYWVGSPISGDVPGEVQNYVFAQITANVPSVVHVIDSRPLVPYPYQEMAPDHEHFFGKEMDQWADKTYDLIQSDLATEGLPSAQALAAARTAYSQPAPEAAKSAAADVVVTARLTAKSAPLSLDQIKPYQESLVSYVYDVQSVQKGDYAEKQIIVVHPAHIAMAVQPLDKLQVGKTYRLRVRELETSRWNTIKTRDDSGRYDLLPYIQVEDDARLPSRNE